MWTSEGIVVTRFDASTGTEWTLGTSYPDPMTTQDAVAPEKATRREWLGLAVLALGALMYVMDLTVLHLAVPKMSEDLQPTSAELLWIIDIYGFFVAGALITMGTLGDRIGRRTAAHRRGSVRDHVPAVAFSTDARDADRQPGAARDRRRDARAVDAVADLPHVPGPAAAHGRDRRLDRGVLGGQRDRAGARRPVLEFFWWGSVFLLAVPVMAALLILGPRVLPEYRDPDAGRLDLPSAVMAIGAVLAVIFGLKQIAQDGLGPLAIGAVVVGLVVGVLWVRRQRRLADPMIDLALFRLPAFNAALVVNFLAIFVAVGYFLFIAQYLQLVAGLTPFQAGLLSLPEAIALHRRLAGGAADRPARRPAYLISGGLAVGAVGLVLLTQVPTANGLLPLVSPRWSSRSAWPRCSG